VRSRASSVKWEYHFLSTGSSSSSLRLLPRLPVTSIPPFISPSITRCRRQFLRKMWPIQLAFRLLISCRIFLCSTLLCHNIMGPPSYMRSVADRNYIIRRIPVFPVRVPAAATFHDTVWLNGNAN
jgi:hypothetical protein